MAIQVHLYLDTRALAADGTAPVKLAIDKRSKTALLPTGVRLLPCQWDAKSRRVVRHPRAKQLNSYLDGAVYRATEYLRGLALSGDAADLSAQQLKARVDVLFNGERVRPTLGQYWERYTASVSPATITSYNSARAALLGYDRRALSRPVGDLSASWVDGLSAYLYANYASTTRNTYLAKVHAVVGLAIADGAVSPDPFRGISMPWVRTKHRDLTLEQLHTLWNAQTRGEAEAIALAFFKFSFLTRAANTADIFKMTPDCVWNGRIDYSRLKTGADYSVKIERELQDLIDRYGDGRWLFAPLHHYRSTQSASSGMRQALAKIAKREGLPAVTPYWVRHTFASLAYSIGISADLVSALLGHKFGGARVTGVYVNIHDRQVDEAARQVYDAALAKKSPRTSRAAKDRK